MPLDMVHSVFPDTRDTIHRGIHRLAALNMVEVEYRRIPLRGALSTFIGLRSASLRRSIYKSVPKARRKNLHRTVALLAEQQGSFPTYFLLHHSLQAGEKESAARHFVKYLKENKSEKRHPLLLTLCKDLTEEKLLEGLPFSDQILVLHELAKDFVSSGQAGVAESLLLESKRLIEAVDVDRKLKNAGLLSATYRLLADWWEARGDFKKALDLLNSVKEELQSALSIPDQAQLLNDIGWLQ